MYTLVGLGRALSCPLSADLDSGQECPSRAGTKEPEWLWVILELPESLLRPKLQLDAELHRDLVLLFAPEALRLFSLIPASPSCLMPLAPPALGASWEQSLDLVRALVLGFLFPLTS